MRQKHKRITRLRQLRRSRELTQAEMAKRVGLHINTYCAIEKGTSEPSLGNAKRIAAIFNQPIEEVFSFVEVPAS